MTDSDTPSGYRPEFMDKRIRYETLGESLALPGNRSTASKRALLKAIGGKW